MSSLSESIKESFRNQRTHLATSDVRFSRILIGTDFSRPAARALQLAVAIAATFNSEIYIVHAVQPLLYGDGQTPMPVEILYAQFEAAKHDINQLVSSEPRLAGLRFRTAVDYGGALDLINRVAKEEKVTLIVLGSHEASGFEKVMLGSVSETVLRRSSCPVLIVGPNCHVESYPFRSILFATDLKTTGLRAAQYASALAEHVDGRLTLLHVIEKRPEKPGFDLDIYEKGLRESWAVFSPQMLNHSVVPTSAWSMVYQAG